MKLGWKTSECTSAGFGLAQEFSRQNQFHRVRGFFKFWFDMQVLQEADRLVATVSPLEKNRFHFSQGMVKHFFFFSAVYIFMSLPVIPACSFAYYVAALLSHGILFIIFPCLTFWIFPVRRKNNTYSW